jgi:hypothetical protein
VGQVTARKPKFPDGAITVRKIEKTVRKIEIEFPWRYIARE